MTPGSPPFSLRTAPCSDQGLGSLDPWHLSFCVSQSILNTLVESVSFPWHYPIPAPILFFFFISASSLPPLFTVFRFHPCLLSVPLIIQIRHCPPCLSVLYPCPASSPYLLSPLITLSQLPWPYHPHSLLPRGLCPWTLLLPPHVCLLEGLSHPLCFRIHVISSERPSLTSPFKVSPPSVSYGSVLFSYKTCHNLKVYIY